MKIKNLMCITHKTKKYNPWLKENDFKKLPQKFIASLISVLILLMGMPLTNLVVADNDTDLEINGTNYTVYTENGLKRAVEYINDKDSGNFEIKLYNDITVNNNIEINKSGISVTIYGEGHTLFFNKACLMITGNAILNLGSANYTNTLSIKDNSPPPPDNATTPLININNNATLNMYNGVTLSGRKSPGTAGGVQLEGTAKFNMYGGEISGCRAECSAAGGVFTTGNSEFIMTGGTIKECSGGYGGVGVRDNGKFIMNGGTIESCKEDYYKNNYGRSGGVSVSGNGKFTMNDGTIKDCESYSTGGGGVYIYVSSADTQGFEMNGGKIINCNAKGYSDGSGLGGGVLIVQGLASIKEGCKIYKNKANLAGDDIFAWGKSRGNVVSNLKLGNVAEGLILEETSHAIDGWYADGVVDGEDTERWNKDDLEHAQKYTPTPDATLTTQFALKAAHGPIVYDYYNYTIKYYIDGELIEELTKTGTADAVNVDDIISIPDKCKFDSKEYVNIVSPTTQAPGNFEVNVYCSKIEDKIKELTCNVELNGQTIKVILQDPNKTLPNDDIYLKVTLVQKGTERWNELVSQFDDRYNIENLAFFDIELRYKSNNQLVPTPLKNDVRVLLQIPDGWDKEDLEAVRIIVDEDIEFEESVITIDGIDYLAFWTNHFSPYALIDKLNDEEAATLEQQGSEDVAAIEQQESEDVATLEQQESKNIEQALSPTGESSSELYMIFSIVLTSCSVMILMFFEKKKRMDS